MRSALDRNSALTSLIDAEVGYSFLVYEVTIVDRDGTALISSDSSLPGRKVIARPPLSQSGECQLYRSSSGRFTGLRKPMTFPTPSASALRDDRCPLAIFAWPRRPGCCAARSRPLCAPPGLLALASVLVSVLLAAVVSNASLAPLERISSQLDHISRGEFDQKPLERADEFGQVSTKIVQIGQQLRGVREIFSTLRENLDQVLGGLEDGLLLFTRDGRAVMVSPAVEHFLGATADHLLGRKAGEIFPPRHPLRAALGLVGDEFEPVAAAEFDLPGAKRARRRSALASACR